MMKVPVSKHSNINRFLLVLLFVLVVCVYLLLNSSITANAWKNPEPTVKITYITPNGNFESEAVSAGSTLTLAEGPVIDGYTFIGWKDKNGNIEINSDIVIYCDTSYAAVYSVALNTKDHIAYIQADEYGFVYPADSVQRGELAEIIYKLLAVEIKGNKGFMDVDKDMSCYDAVNALRQLNVISGSRFHPESPATLREVLELLSAFFPRAEGSAEFASPAKGSADYELCRNAAMHGWIESGSEVSVVLDSDICRGDLAAIINRVLGRKCEENTSRELTGALTDVSPTNQWFYDLVEASVAHEYTLSSGTEVWTASEPGEGYEPGFVLLNLYLYYVNEDGTVLVNGEKDGFTFDNNGRYTSGNKETDALVHKLIVSNYKDGMSTDELLKAVYDDIVNNYNYRKGNLYEKGEELPSAQLAYDFLTIGKGNCYSFACAFYEAARALHYDINVYSGTVIGMSGKRTEHGWTEVTIDGTLYYCDPEMEFECTYWNNVKRNFYMVLPDNCKGMGYRR